MDRIFGFKPMITWLRKPINPSAPYASAIRKVFSVGGTFNKISPRITHAARHEKAKGACRIEKSGRGGKGGGAGLRRTAVRIAEKRNNEIPHAMEIEKIQTALS